MAQDKKSLEALRENYRGQLRNLLGDVETLKRTIAKLDEQIDGNIEPKQQQDKIDLTKKRR